MDPSNLSDSFVDIEKPHSIILGRSYGASDKLNEEDKEERDQLMIQPPTSIKPLLFTSQEIIRLWKMENPLGCSVEDNMTMMFCSIS